MEAVLGSLRGEDLHKAIQERIKRIILDRHLRSGDPLPTEADLTRDLGVGRNSVREAIKALQTLGVVEIRHGLGTFVGNFSLDPLVDGLTLRILISVGRDTRTVHELLDVRQVLETGLVIRVTGLHTAEELDELDALVTAMEAQADRGEIFPEEDRRFHEALYRPLHNELLGQLLQVFWQVFHTVRAELPGEPGPPSRSAERHRRILDALLARDGAAAAAAMDEHFNGIRGWLKAPASVSTHGTPSLS